MSGNLEDITEAQPGIECAFSGDPQRTGTDVVYIGIKRVGPAKTVSPIVHPDYIWIPIDRHEAEDLGLVRPTEKIILVPKPPV